MTPEVKKIGNKLFEKVELASHKIDLTISDDIQKGLAAYKTLDDATKSAKGKARTGLDAYLSSVGAAYQNAKNTVDMITTLEAKAKELGLGDTPFTTYKKEMIGKVNGYKSLFNFVDGVAQSISK